MDKPTARGLTDLAGLLMEVYIRTLETAVAILAGAGLIQVLNKFL